MTIPEPKKQAFLLDTNVWVDFFIDRSRNHDLAASLVATARCNGIPLYSPIEATKDVYFIVAAELKRLEREASGTVSGSFANATNEIAWSALNTIRRQSTIVGADLSDVIEAIALRNDHSDYEDNLIIAAARRAHASRIVSSDTLLQKHSPIPCIGLQEALELAREEVAGLTASRADGRNACSFEN